MAGTSRPLFPISSVPNVGSMKFTRSSGVQLHVTSLPGGRLGPQAYRFVDWLEAAGQAWWQVLPLGPPDRARSPYKARSAFAAWPGLLADPSASVSAAERDAFREKHAVWIDDWASFAGGRRAGVLRGRPPCRRRPGPLRPRVGRPARVRRRARRAAHRRRADLRGARERRPRRAPRAVPRRRRRRCAARLLLVEGAALGQPDLRLARAAAAALPMVGRALPARVRPLRPRAHRPLPRFRRLLVGAARLARRPPRALGARAGARAVRRRPGRARAAADHRRGPRGHHAAGRAPARFARVPRHGGPAVRLRPRRPPQPPRPAPPPREPGPLHGHARQRHAPRLVRGAAGAPPGAAARGGRRRPDAVVGPDRARARLARAAVHAAGARRARPRQRGADAP